MKSKRSLRSFSNTLTAIGLALSVSACASFYQEEWNQGANVPDLNEPLQRSAALLDYCKKLHNRGDLNLAASICNRAHEINPTDPAPLVQLARVLEDLEMTAQAEEAYRAALLLNPQQVDALYGLGKIYIDQQRYDLAMGPLEAAAAGRTSDPRVYNALGVIMDQQGQHRDAQVYYQRGLAQSPRNVSLRNNYGLSMVLSGQPEAGLAMLRDVAAEPESGPTAGRNLEMATQIAAQQILENSANSASIPIPPAQPQSGTEDLSTLSPSAAPDQPAVDTPSATQAPSSEPLPLLQPQSRRHGEELPASASAAPYEDEPRTLPEGTPSLDHELADAIVAQPSKEPQIAATPSLQEAPQAIEEAIEVTPEAPEPIAETAQPRGEMASERRFEASEPAPVQTSIQAAALPQAEPKAEPETEAAPAAQTTPQDEDATPRDWSLAAETVFAASGLDAAEPAPEAAPEPATEPVPEVAAAVDDLAETETESETPRDWSLAAQTVFASSGVDLPEPSPITSQERVASNDAFHADPTPEAAAEEEFESAREWSLAAQTMFAISSVAVPEPSKITAPERAAANDAFHADPAPEASAPETETPVVVAEAAPEPEAQPEIRAEVQEDLALAPASRPEDGPGVFLATETYAIDGDTFYTAQLASFHTAARARTGWEILRESAGELLEHSEGYIVRADLGAEMGTYYRVRTGVMDDQAAASRFCLDLRAEGLDCLPVEASLEDTTETLVEKICQSAAPGVICRTVQRSEVTIETTPPNKG